MDILVLTGSPHREGSSALLAESFVRGAQEAGHHVARFDAAFCRIGPCVACDGCAETGVCVLKDEFEALRPHLLAADLVVFVTPLYYFGMSAQLKRVIDRFYSVNSQLMESAKQAMLLVTAGDTDPTVSDALEAHFQAICSYLRWQDGGRLLAHGVNTRADLEQTDFPQKAYAMGRTL